MEDHKEKVQSHLISGALKFSLDYKSKQDIYEAVSQWVKDDSHVLMAAIRGGGEDQIAVDFRYDGSEVNARASDFLKSFKEYFASKLGEKCMIGWDYSGNVIVVK